MFESILGHEKEKKILINDIQNESVSHAYVFSGPKGIGKRTTAEEFARKFLNVDNLSSTQDYKYISKNIDKKEILVGQIREEIIENIHVKPCMSDYKIYIIDNADSLNIQAQNTLLKTLEEPPYYVVIILIVEKIQRLLPTIVSRVKEIQFMPLQDSVISTYMKDKYGDKEFDNNMLKYINGSIGKIEILGREGELENFREIEKIVNGIKRGDILGTIKKIDKLSFKNPNILDYLEYTLFYEGLASKIVIVEKVRNKLIRNGNEDIIKTKMSVDICR